MSRQIMDMQNDKLGELFEKTNANFDELYSSTAEHDSAIKKKAEQSDLERLRNQVNANVAANTEENADYAAEVVDARVGEDGTIYSSLGEAVRGQVGGLKEDLTETESRLSESMTEIRNNVLNTITLVPKVKYDSGTWDNKNFMAGNNNYVAYDGILIPKGAKYVSVNYTFADENPNYRAYVFTVNNNNGPNHIVESGMSASKDSLIAIPETAKFVKFTGLKGFNASVSFFDSEVESIRKDVELLKADVDVIKPLSNMADKYSVVGKNMLELYTRLEIGKYIVNNGGKIKYSDNTTYNTYLIPIEAKEYVISALARFVCLVAEDGETIIGSIESNKRGFDNTIENAKYVAVSVHASGDYDIREKDAPKTEVNILSGKWDLDLYKSVNLHCYLPKEIYVAVGRTIELYNSLVCLEAGRYHLDWVCNVGTDYARKWSVTGVAEKVGTYPLTLNIYDDDLNAIESLTSTVKIVANSILADKNIVPIGDSLTNNKAWLPEVQTLSESKIHYVGTRKRSGYEYSHEGRSGATASWYNTNGSYTFDTSYIGNPDVDGASNPFWDGTKFSLSHYISSQNGYVAAPDAVQLLLGTNGIALDATANVTEIKKIVDNIASEYPTMPIFVVNTIYRSNQNGYYSVGSDGYEKGQSDFQYSADLKVMNLQNALAETFKDYSKVYIVPCSVCMDREYNFGQKEVYVNPRSTVTKTIPKESIHPQNEGYMQMADVMYSAYCAVLN